MKHLALCVGIAALAFAPGTMDEAAAQSHDGLVAMHAAANGVPASLVRRVIMRESRGNARAVSKGNYGLMQIRLGTARGMGYTGSAAGLLDANTNMTYAVKYLAGAYRAAGGNESRAVALYASGYYYAAKRQNAKHNSKDQARLAFAAPDLTGWTGPARVTGRQRYASLQPQAQQDVTALDVAPAAQTATPRAQRSRARATAATANPFAALFAPNKPRRAGRR